MSESTLASEAHADTTLSAFTIQIALHVALACGALFIRLFGLGLAPLNSIEALQAMAAYNFTQGAASSFTGSPLLFTADAIFFALFTASDFTARLAPALAGAALVLLPMLFRRELGRLGALIASLLLAFSPSLLFFSRTLDGAIPAAAAALGVVAFGARYLANRTAPNLYASAACAAVALVSGPDVWTVALALGIAWLASRLSTRSRAENQPESIVMEHNAGGNEKRFAGVVFVIVLLTSSTTFLLHREGLGAAFDLLATWLENLRLGGSLFGGLRLLLIYEPLVTLFGIIFLIEFIFASRESKRGPLLTALSFWVATALVLLAFSGNDNPGRIVVGVVSLAVLAGASIGAWVEKAIEQARGLGLGELLMHEVPILAVNFGLIAFLSIVIAELARRGNVVIADVFFRFFGSSLENPGIGSWIVFLLFSFAFIAATVLALTTLGVTRARNIGTLLGLLLLSAWTFRQAMMLNFPGTGAYRAQEWLVSRAASPDVRDLVNDLESQSRWHANDTHSLVISADTRLGPIVEWNLRSFPYARFTSRPTAEPGVQALLTTIDAPPPVGAWIAQRYQLETTRGPGVVSALRALIYRDVGVLESTNAILWVPTP